jgi:hypothetical protein
MKQERHSIEMKDFKILVLDRWEVVKNKVNKMSLAIQNIVVKLDLISL